MTSQLTENEYAYTLKSIATNPDQDTINAALETAISELRVRLGKLQDSNGYDEGPLGAETLHIDLSIAILIQLLSS